MLLCVWKNKNKVNKPNRLKSEHILLAVEKAHDAPHPPWSVGACIQPGQ